eukprot:TRINITY_DN13561_c0_g1_i1.p1 TRINITY_DN13561_c0_g1~~TRINITY_DN13561_c0_g1_i1.p1  ORF type:complete len:424 (+),score=64.73 TRINITY_DN13561_c0_g1_i1:262-1533(+)
MDAMAAGSPPRGAGDGHEPSGRSSSWTRRCGETSFEYLQWMVDATGYLMGVSSGEGICVGGRGNQGGFCRKARDVCMPTYHPTQVINLEENRQQMGLALLGQFVVVTFRVLTGNFSGAIIGAMVFVCGQQARCTLQPVCLTSFVILGYTMGALDTADLARHALSVGSGFFALPFKDNVLLDLSAISLIMAPIVEVTGSRIAWDSYLQPSMLFLPATPSAPPAQALRPAPWQDEPSGLGGLFTSGFSTSLQDYLPLGGGGYTGPDLSFEAPWKHGYEAYRNYNSAVQAHLRFAAPPPAAPPSEGSFSCRRRPTSSGGASACSEPPAPVPSRDSWSYWSTSWWPSSASPVPEEEECQKRDDRPASSFSYPSSSMDRHMPEDVIMCCNHCGHKFTIGPEGWLGSGRFADVAYCRACWESWLGRRVS